MGAASAAAHPPGLPLTDGSVAAATSEFAVAASPAPTPPIQASGIESHWDADCHLDSAAFSKTKMFSLRQTTVDIPLLQDVRAQPCEWPCGSELINHVARVHVT